MEEATERMAEVLVAMQQMMAAQQAELKALRDQQAQSATSSGDDSTKSRGPSVDSLEKQIRLFNYNADEGWTYEAWWTRHEGLFNSVNVDDKEKNLMLLRHVDDSVDRQFRDHIRPKKLEEMSFSEVQGVMTKLFGDKKTIFEKRLEMFNLKMSKVSIDDLREFATRVNRVVEDADVTQLTPDKIKTMIFLAGVDLPRHTGAMFHIINGMKREENPTLEKLLEIADSFKEAQLDSQTVTGQNRSQVNAVRQHYGKGKERSRRDRSSSADSENDGCERCGRDHDEGRCPFVNAICHKCKETGHIRVKCPGKNKGTKPKFNKIKSERSGNSSEFDVLMKVNGKEVEMSVDSGSDLTFISQHTWKLVGSPRARCTNVTPECPNKSIFLVTGKCNVNLEMNGIEIFGEVYITEDANVLGKEHMQFFFTLIPKRAEAQLNHSIGSIEVTEKDERLHSGTGGVKDHSRNYSIAIEGTEKVKDQFSGNGTEVNEVFHSGTGLVTNESRNYSIAIEGTEKVKDPFSGNGTEVNEVFHSGTGLVTNESRNYSITIEDIAMVKDPLTGNDDLSSGIAILERSGFSPRRSNLKEEVAVAYCALKKDREILTSESMAESLLAYELKFVPLAMAFGTDKNILPIFMEWNKKAEQEKTNKTPYTSSATKYLRGGGIGGGRGTFYHRRNEREISHGKNSGIRGGGGGGKGTWGGNKGRPFTHYRPY